MIFSEDVCITRKVIDKAVECITKKMLRQALSIFAF